MSMDAHPRFRAAILSARSLHPDLLTQPQKLKLYALFRQSQGSAPADPPADPTALAQAKWEAWRDVRGLSQQEAMDAYSEIIEGLSSLMAALGPDGGPPPPDKRFVEDRPERPREQDAQDYEEEEDEEEDEEEGEDDDEGDDEDEDYEDEDEPPPEVSQTVWQTEGVNVAAGDTFAVPLPFDTPCKCSFSYSILPGSTGPIGFHIYATESFSGDLASARPVVSEYTGSHEGSAEVSPPGGGAAALRIVLDNRASTFSSIDVKVRVCLEPLHELAAEDNYRSRQALRGLIRRKEADLEAHESKHDIIGQEAAALQSRLDALRVEVARCEGELKLKYKQVENGAEMGEIMAAEINELRRQLKQAP